MFISDFTYYSGYFQITGSPHPHSNATPKLNIRTDQSIFSC